MAKRKGLTKVQAKAMMKKVCPDCTESTVLVYVRNLFRLARLIGHEELPASGTWLSDKKLYKEFEKQKLNTRRLLAVAAVKGTKMYGLKQNPDWGAYMTKASDAYDKQRDERHKTKREKDRWPTKGYDALKIAADKMKKDVLKYFKKDKLSVKDLYALQKYVILKLYSEHALRLDWADVKLGKTDDKNKNFIHKFPRKGWILTMRKYKTSKFLGEQEIKVSRAASLALSMFIPHVKKTTTHGYLLSTLQGNKLSRSGLSKILIRLTEKHLGSKIGAQIIRVLKATKFRKQTEANAALAKEMMHGKEQHLQYSKKD
jgi:hypothetical protein